MENNREKICLKKMSKKERIHERIQEKSIHQCIEKKLNIDGLKSCEAEVLSKIRKVLLMLKFIIMIMMTLQRISSSHLGKMRMTSNKTTVV